jgi:hypothetical protein
VSSFLPPEPCKKIKILAITAIKSSVAYNRKIPTALVYFSKTQSICNGRNIPLQMRITVQILVAFECFLCLRLMMSFVEKHANVMSFKRLM